MGEIHWRPLAQTSLHITRGIVLSCCLLELVGLKGLRSFDDVLGFIMLRLAQRKALDSSRVEAIAGTRVEAIATRQKRERERETGADCSQS